MPARNREQSNYSLHGLQNSAWGRSPFNYLPVQSRVKSRFFRNCRDRWVADGVSGFVTLFDELASHVCHWINVIWLNLHVLKRVELWSSGPRHDRHAEERGISNTAVLRCLWELIKGNFRIYKMGNGFHFTAVQIYFCLRRCEVDEWLKVANVVKLVVGENTNFFIGMS